METLGSGARIGSDRWGDRALLPALIGALEAGKHPVLAAEMLQIRTGRAFGTDTDQWRRWWTASNP